MNDLSTVQALTITTLTIVGIIGVICSISSLASASSMSALWSIFNQVQMFYLLLITRAYIPDEVQLTITGLKFMFNPYSYIKFDKLSIYNPVTDNFDFELSDSYLTQVSINSDSTVYNTFSFFNMLLIAAIFHLCIFVINKLVSLSKSRQRWQWLINWIKKINDKLIALMTFGYYIRSLLEINQYFLISTIHEIYRLNISTVLRAVSFAISIILLIICLSMIVLTILLTYSSYNLSENKHNKLGEIYEGLKSQKKFKYFSSFFLIRRALYVCLLITLMSISSRLLIIIIVLFQILFPVYWAILRPYHETKINIIAIMNEIYFLCLIISLIYFNTEAQWSTRIATVYIWVISSNSIAMLLIIFGIYYHLIFSWLAKKCY